MVDYAQMRKDTVMVRKQLSFTSAFLSGLINVGHAERERSGAISREFEELLKELERALNHCREALSSVEAAGTMLVGILGDDPV